MPNPELLLLDEPTVGLDPDVRQGIWDIISSLSAEGKTIIFTTHYMEEAAKADKVIVIDRGVIALSGTPKQVFKQKEILSSLGLELPAAGIIAEKLRARGAKISDGIITEEELTEALWTL